MAGGCVDQEAGSQNRRKEKGLLGLIIAESELNIRHPSWGQPLLRSLFENVLHATWKTLGNPKLAKRGPC